MMIHNMMASQPALVCAGPGLPTRRAYEPRRVGKPPDCPFDQGFAAISALANLSASNANSVSRYPVSR
jgi:hypothetical protein